MQLQRLDQVVALERAQAWIGQRVENLEHLALVMHDRAPPRLGRVRGKHRPVAQAGEQFAQRLGIDALLAKLLEGVIKRAEPGGVAVFLDGGPPQAVQVILLGDIDQVEVNREGANDLGHDRRRQALDQSHQLAAFRFALALAQPDEAGAQRLDRVEYLGPLVLEQDVADQLAEQLDPRAQLLVGLGMKADARYAHVCGHSGGELRVYQPRAAALYEIRVSSAD